MKNVNLSVRFEPSQRYDANTQINTAISAAFKDSLKTVILPAHELLPFPQIIYTVDSAFYVSPTHSIDAGDLTYGDSTLAASGCAVFCFHQGLASQLIYADLDELADEIVSKGYYEPGKGKLHNLFDHYGLKRATHYQEIVDALSRESIVTVLVKNAAYHCDAKRTGNHFVNIVGYENGKFWVDDPAIGRRLCGFTQLLEAVLVAWIW